MSYTVTTSLCCCCFSSVFPSSIYIVTPFLLSLSVTVAFISCHCCYCFSLDLTLPNPPLPGLNSYLYCVDFVIVFLLYFHIYVVAVMLLSFSRDDPVRIHFYLVFYGTGMDDGVVRSVPRVIRRLAPPVYYLVYLTYRVGDLLVLPEKRPGVDPSPSVYPTNITVLPSTLKPTATMMTTTDISSTDISPSSSYIETPSKSVRHYGTG